jgi:hypothetical protein
VSKGLQHSPTWLLRILGDMSFMPWRGGYVLLLCRNMGFSVHSVQATRPAPVADQADAQMRASVRRASWWRAAAFFVITKREFR